MSIDYLIDPELRLPRSGSGPLPPKPRGVIVTELAGRLSIVVHPPAVVGPWIFAVALLLMVRSFWIGKIEPGLTTQIVGFFFTALAPLWVFNAAFRTWGNFAIEIHRTAITQSIHLWCFRWKKVIEVDRLRLVHLRYQRRRMSSTKTIELVADRTIDFGAELTDEQRAYVAALLFQKLREMDGRRTAP